MRVIIEAIFLAFGALIAGFSVAQKKLPKGILEWVIWIADIVIIALRISGR